MWGRVSGRFPLGRPRLWVTNPQAVNRTNLAAVMARVICHAVMAIPSGSEQDFYSPKEEGDLMETSQVFILKVSNKLLLLLC